MPADRAGSMSTWNTRGGPRVMVLTNGLEEDIRNPAPVTRTQNTGAGPDSVAATGWAAGVATVQRRQSRHSLWRGALVSESGSNSSSTAIQTAPASAQISIQLAPLAAADCAKDGVINCSIRASAASIADTGRMPIQRDRKGPWSAALLAGIVNLSRFRLPVSRIAAAPAT